MKILDNYQQEVTETPMDSQISGASAPHENELVSEPYQFTFERSMEDIIKRNILNDPYVPILTLPHAMMSLILNILFPGFGTIFSSFVQDSVDYFSIFVGILQFFTSFFFIGWIWSIFHSCIILLKSKQFYQQIDHQPSM